MTAPLEWSVRTTVIGTICTSKALTRPANELSAAVVCLFLAFFVADQDAIPVVPIRGGCKLRKEFQGSELLDGKGFRE
jgi:hypothetical protein